VESDNAGHSERCDEIVARHSDYLDCLLVPHVAAQVQWHLSQCASCARYDRIVRRGLALVREVPEIAPAEDFAERLQHRIYHLQDGRALAGERSANAAATFAVASVIALLAWSPMLFSGSEPAPVRTASEQEEPAWLTATPLTSRDDLWSPAPAAELLGGTDPRAILAAFPGPYSPLVVMPPVHGGTVRTVSSGYAPID
jgi:hypothetical protein